ncbi:MAG: peptidylprolyl isomerase [Bacteroidales bacterium]
MATLQKLRNRGPLLIIFIGIGLLGFILMDFIEQGGSLFNRSQHEIAEISGKSIPHQLYQERVDQIVELNKASRKESALDEETMNNIREEVWNELVQEYVLDDRYEKLGIAISSQELFDMVQGDNIHPLIQREFGNPQTGEVDTEMVIQFLKNMDQDPSGLQKAIWLYLENIIKRDRLFTKYNNLISKGVYVTDFQTELAASNRSKQVDFSYVVARYTSIADSAVTVTSKEIKDFHKKNEHMFEQEASRDVEYVVFPIEPSEDDFKIAEEWINDIKDEFVNANDPVHFTNLSSDLPFDDTYYKQGELPSEELNQWAFSASEGDHIGPLFDGDAYKLARLVDVAHLPDSVKARHILISTEVQSQEEFDAASAKADSIHNLVKANKGSFASLAREHSDDPGSGSKGGDLGWFTEGQMVKPFNDACFNASSGDIVKVETQFGIHIIEVQELGRLTKKVQVAIMQRNVIPSTKTYQAIYQKASEFAGTNNSYEEFENAIKEQKLSKRIASNLKEADRNISGLENPRRMIQWAFEAKKHEVADIPFETGENFVVPAVKDVREEGIAPVSRVKNEIEDNIIIEKKAEMLKEQISTAMNDAGSIDNLSESLSLAVQQANRISFASFSMPTVGAEPAVIATATNSPEGELVGPVKGNAGVYALTVSAINIDDAVDEESERRRLKNQLQSRAMREPFEAIKENANIIDRRAKFY